MKKSGGKAGPNIGHPLVLIEWTDASRLAVGWMDYGDIPDPYLHRGISVGFLISENKNGKIIVPTIADFEHPDNRHAYGGMLIPKSAILSERRLK
ncbi:hypothetical protein HU230_0032995 [Bradyrhizobium quebecense]|uniref:Uncharacterized protein n=1 Tax=Bradyrhizobium quebecense TaxID=2748629 RepID=A0A974AGB1_9BRAD|nr:hypothetical protein [Bradyrhizobium quebecense]UGA43049.1 hypothetical protein HU230_0032995 [Bradyrhizobium quebecense]